MIPRPSSLRDIRRNQEDEARRREQQTNSRKSDNTTVSRGGTFDVDGNFNVRNGGVGTIELGGKMNVQGSLDITESGEATVTGQGPEWYGGDNIPIVTCLGNRTAWNPWVGYSYTQPGVYFSQGESLGALDPRVISEGDGAVEVISASEILQYGPQVGPNIKSDSSLAIRPGSASIGSGSWDQSVNYEGREGLAGLRGSSYGYFTPSEFSIGLDNYEYLGAIPQGPVARIEASLENRKLRLSGMDGVDIKGPFTVDGQPVGGAVTSVAGKTGEVSLAKGDVGLGSVDNTSDANKPVSNSTQTALNGKSATTHTHANATTSTAGFMSAADKVALGIAAQKFSATYTAVTSTASLVATSPGTLNLVAAESENAATICTVTTAGKVRIEVSGHYSIDWFGFHGGVAAGTDSYMNITSTHRTERITSIDIPAESGSSALAIGSIYIPAGAVISFNCAFRVAQPNLRSFICINKR